MKLNCVRCVALVQRLLKCKLTRVKAHSLNWRAFAPLMFCKCVQWCKVNIALDNHNNFFQTFLL
jgi:hypothetical protein